MKKNIHPKYGKIQVSCSCSNNIEIKSTLRKKINIDICSACHPFYTGKQRTIDAQGRINLFHKRFGLLVKN